MKYGRKILLMMIIVALAAWILCQGTSNPIRLALAGVPFDTSYALKHADQFILYSLEPYLDSHSKLADKSIHPPEQFHGHDIVGIMEITNKDERKELLHELFTCIPNRPPSMIAMCFNPRHGIRVIRDGKTVDLLICFECRGMRIYGSSEAFLNLGPGDDSEFNRVLKAAGVKLPDH